MNDPEAKLNEPEAKRGGGAHTIMLTKQLYTESPWFQRELKQWTRTTEI